MLKGIVIKLIGSWYYVKIDEGEIYCSCIIGKFRLVGKKIINFVVVGDWVVVDLEDNEEKMVLIKIIFFWDNYVVC